MRIPLSHPSTTVTSRPAALRDASIDNLIEKARSETLQKQLQKVQFEVGDCGSIDVGRQFEIVLCLYDVIGTYADEKENVAND